MKHLKTPQELNEASENLNISDVMNSILSDLKKLQDEYDNSPCYDDDEYNTIIVGKSKGIEESISIIKKYYS
jgi:hypothetical protein